MTTPHITLANVSVSYRTASEVISALTNVSLSIEEGDFIALAGASGSGKTTLINVMAGLQLPDEGRVTVAGHDLEMMGEKERAHARLHDIGVVFQDHNLIPEFTALENVALPSRARGLRKQQAVTDAAASLNLVGLGELGGRLPVQLSGGQRQRVGIARALCGGKKVLLADEPTGSLDTENSHTVFALLRRLSDDGVTVVLASHDPAVSDFADTTLTMYDGHTPRRDRVLPPLSTGPRAR